MLECPATEIDIKERSPLSLAFVGDGVLELLVRSHLVCHSRLAPGALHREAVTMVSARAQFGSLELIEPVLTDRERDVVRRGRNASKASVSKNATPEEYRASTGMEALFGWLYLQNQQERITELFSVVWEHYLEQQP